MGAISSSHPLVGQERGERVPPPPAQRVTGSGKAERSTDVTPPARYGSLDEACTAEYRRLVGLLTLYCGDREVAFDLAQETCARACARWSSVSRMQDQRAWFTKVAFNLSRSRWRRQAVERRVLSMLGGSFGGTVRDVASALTVQAAMATLTPRQRAAVVLRFFDDLEVAATAEIMGCSTGTVKKLTAQGLATLRTQLEFDDLVGGDDG